MILRSGFIFVAILVSTSCLAAEPTPQTDSVVALTGFSWDHVPLNIHFGKRSSDMTDAEIDFLASHSQLISLEKNHGLSAHGSTEAGVADTARRIKQRNPAVKVLFYLNTFINWPGYESYKTYRPEWTLRDTEGKEVMKTATVSRPDPSNADFREWWSNVVAAEMKRGPIDGIFADALPQALAPALAKEVGPEKAQAVVAGLREMLALTKRKIGPDRIILANGTRSTNYREILDWEGIDGVMIEHFDAINTTKTADIKADLDTIALAAAKGKFVVIKAWPGFTFIDKGPQQNSWVGKWGDRWGSAPGPGIFGGMAPVSNGKEENGPQQPWRSGA